jgi:hypothetical protein
MSTMHLPIVSKRSLVDRSSRKVTLPAHCPNTPEGSKPSNRSSKRGLGKSSGGIDPGPVRIKTVQSRGSL